MSEEYQVNTEKSHIENLVELMEKKLTLKEGECDLIVMQHIFKIKTKDEKLKTTKSTLIKIGT